MQLEMVSCGDCKDRQTGRVHGPYWYRYYRVNGKMVSEYVGKKIPAKDATDEIPAGSTPEALFPERVQKTRNSAKEDARKRFEALPRARQEIVEAIVSVRAEARGAYRRSKKEDTSARTRKAAAREHKGLLERAVDAKAKPRESA